MRELIEKHDAIDALIEEFKRTPTVAIRAKHTVEKLPSAQPERKTGKWERHYSRPNVYADLCWHCSECGYKSSYNWANHYNFCPNCGSKMEEKEC